MCVRRRDGPSMNLAPVSNFRVASMRVRQSWLTLIEFRDVSFSSGMFVCASAGLVFACFVSFLLIRSAVVSQTNQQEQDRT